MQPYNTTEPKKEQVQRMFDRIAPRYDLLNRVLSFGVDRGWRRKLVRQVRRDGPGTILDVATGTGDLAISIAGKCPAGTVTGLDLSPGMLDIARRKASAVKNGGSINFVAGEAENLPFADGEFAAVTAAFGVRNFHDIQQGVAEMARVLKTGGRVYILEFSTPRNKLFGALYKWYFHKVLPFIGGIVSRDMNAYRYLPSSVDEFPPPDVFRQIMARAGFEGCLSRSFTGGIACLYTGTKKRASSDN